LSPALRGTVELGTAPAPPPPPPPPAAPPPPPPPPPLLGLSVDAGGTVDRKTGVATISGAVSPSEAAQVAVSGSAQQPAKRGAGASGSFASSVVCSPPSSAWKATLRSTTGTAFAAGAVSVSASATATGAQTASASAVVGLAR
jgi:hypothetical protein